MVTLPLDFPAQKYKGGVFEQLESGWAKQRSVEDETEQNNKTRHRDQSKMNK